MKTELLQPGQDPAGLPEGRRPAELGEANAGSLTFHFDKLSHVNLKCLFLSFK